MMPSIERCKENPIVWPGKYPWRMCSVYNPAVIHDEGKFWMYDRASGSLRPHQCQIGLLSSEDGVQNADQARRRQAWCDAFGPGKPREGRRARAAFHHEPEAYYEKFGLFIPNVIFPTGNVVKDGTL